MHKIQHSYYFLSKLADFLGKFLTGASLKSVINLENKALLLIYNQGEDEFQWKITFHKNQLMFSFPNSVNTNTNLYKPFEPLISQKLKSVACLENDRHIKLEFENEYCLFIKSFSAGAIYLTHQNDLLDKFPYHSKPLADLPNAKELDLSRSKWLEKPVLKNFWPLLTEIEMEWLAVRHFADLDPDSQWEMISDLKNRLEYPNHFYLCKTPSSWVISVIDSTFNFESSFSPLEICNLAFHQIVVVEQFNSEKDELIEYKRKQLQRLKNTWSKLNERLISIRNGGNYRKFGDLIMAHLHELEKGLDRFITNDFETDVKIEIPLNPKYTPYENAENYYRKAKNLWKEIETIQKTLISKELEISELEKEIESISKIEDWKKLKKEKKIKVETAKQADEPFYRHEFEGWEIYVGKNATKNDELTQKYAFKEDLWLHSKYTSGSHVIIKYQSGKKYPAHVIERAAEMAAYYSKAKNESFASVIVTPKKFVRKPKGSPPGTVVVDKEEVVLVTPRP